MVQFVPMGPAAPVRYRQGPDPALVNLQLLKEALGAVGDVGGILKGQADNQALADVLQGTPGRPAIAPTMGGEVEPGTGRVSTPDAGRPATAGTALLPPELLPIAQRLAMSGDHDAAVKMVTDYQASIRPEPISPYQQAQIDIAQQGQDLRAEGMELDREGLKLQRDQFASDRDFKRAELALKELDLALEGQTAGNAKLSDIGSFRSQYTGLSQDFIKIRDAYGKVRGAVDNPSPAGDLSLIFGYMKMLDPGSTVREGEQATAQNTTGAAGMIGNLYNRLVTGERLNEAQRADFAEQAELLFRSQLEQQEQLQQSYRGIAGRMAPNVLPDDAVPDFIGKSREWIGGISTSPLPPPAAGQQGTVNLGTGERTPAPGQTPIGAFATMTSEQINAIDVSRLSEEQLRALDARERQLGIN